MARIDRGKSARFAQAATASEAPKGGSFFKTRQGAIALLLMAVGTGYVVYTATSERNDNPVR